MKLALVALTALALSPSVVFASGNSQAISMCLQTQYSGVRTALERDAKDAGAAEGVDPAPLLAQLDGLMQTLEEGRADLAAAAAADPYGTLNLVDNIYGGDDSVSRKIHRAMEVCIL
jgi:hypothetical protein